MHLEYIGNVIEGRGVVVDGENQIVDTTKIIRVNKCIEVYREKSRVRLFETWGFRNICPGRVSQAKKWMDENITKRHPHGNGFRKIVQCNFRSISLAGGPAFPLPWEAQVAFPPGRRERIDAAGDRSWHDPGQGSPLAEISPFLPRRRHLGFPRAQVNTDYFAGSCESVFRRGAVTSTDCVQPCH